MLICSVFAMKLLKAQHFILSKENNLKHFINSTNVRCKHGNATHGAASHDKLDYRMQRK